jgi:hypothetical protein
MNSVAIFVEMHSVHRGKWKSDGKLKLCCLCPIEVEVLARPMGAPDWLR